MFSTVPWTQLGVFGEEDSWSIYQVKLEEGSEKKPLSCCSDTHQNQLPKFLGEAAAFKVCPVAFPLPRLFSVLKVNPSWSARRLEKQHFAEDLRKTCKLVAGLIYLQGNDLLNDTHTRMWECKGILFLVFSFLFSIFPSSIIIIGFFSCRSQSRSRYLPII